MKFIFLLITEIAKALTGALGKIFNTLLVPINEVVEIATKIPKMIYKSMKDIFDIGIFALISHYFHSILIKAFPFLKYMKSFMIVITLVIIVMSILIVCPMIGAYYAFFKPYNYVKTTVDRILEQIKYTFKNAKNLKIIINKFIDSLEFADELNKQLNNMKSSYKYTSGVIIIIIVIFIILNMFTNVNKNFLIFIRNILHNNYKGKYDDIRKQFASYKLNKIIKESNEMKGVTKNYDTLIKVKKESNEMKGVTKNYDTLIKVKKEENENNNKKEMDNSSILNRIDNIKNLGFNQLKSFT